MSDKSKIELKEMIDHSTGEVVNVNYVDGKNYVNNTNEPQYIMQEVKAGEKVYTRHINPLPFQKGKEEFVMFFMGQVSNISKDLTNEEKSFLFTILPYLSYNGKINIPNSDGMVTDLSYSKAAEIMGWNSGTTRTKHLNSLVRKGIIVYTGKRPKLIILNPLLFYRGDMAKRKLAYMDFEKRSQEVKKELEQKKQENTEKYLN